MFANNFGVLRRVDLTASAVKTDLFKIVQLLNIFRGLCRASQRSFVTRNLNHTIAYLIAGKRKKKQMKDIEADTNQTRTVLRLTPTSAVLIGYIVPVTPYYYYYGFFKARNFLIRKKWLRGVFASLKI